jgi:hypothetical protein
MKATHPEYIPKLKALYALLEHHIAEEEKDDLPKFERALNSEDGVSEKLAASFQRTKAFIPTRSHPSAGEVRSIAPYQRGQANQYSEPRFRISHGIADGSYRQARRSLPQVPREMNTSRSVARLLQSSSQVVRGLAFM